MQFALPPRRSPHSLPGAHSPRLPLYRRKQLKTIAIFAFAILTILYLLSHFFNSPSTLITAPAGTAGVVIVTLLDRQSLSESYINKIVANREDYAKRHGYTNFFASVSDYEEAIGDDAPRSWALIPAVRHAMAAHPKAAYFFHLSPHALIMNPVTSLKSHLLDRTRLESLMLKDFPIVPPDSIIKTFALKEKEVDLIITQDSEDLSPSSFVLKNGDFARFFLDLWFDPLFRSYNFGKAEIHGLDHIMQWHPTLLARTALVPQRVLNAYSKDSSGASPDGFYKDGDFVIRFPACDEGKRRDCDELDPYYSMWWKKMKSA